MPSGNRLQEKNGGGSTENARRDEGKAEFARAYCRLFFRRIELEVLAPETACWFESGLAQRFNL